MANPTNANPCCSSPVNTQVPGPAGTNGAAGQNAYTTTTAQFTVPAIGGMVTVQFVNASWMVSGSIIAIGDGSWVVHFQVLSPAATSANLQFMGYYGDGSPGIVIQSGARVSPSGTQPALTIPWGVNQGGTGAITAAAARANLGAAASGANSDITSLSALATPLSASQGGTGVASLAALLSALPVQYGSATLVAGTVTVSSFNITAQSVIVVCLKTPGGTRTSFAGYKQTSITPGNPGSFILTAIDATGATLAACTDVVSFIIVG